MQLKCVPRGLCSWDFRLTAEGDAIGSTRLDTFTEQGAVEIGGARHEVVKHGMISGRWSLMAGDGSGEWVTAEKPSALSNRFEIAEGEGAYLLQRQGWVGRLFELWEGERRAMSIEPAHAFTRRATIRGEDELGMEIVLFSFWLTVMAWRRMARSSGGGGAAGAGGG